MHPSRYAIIFKIIIMNIFALHIILTNKNLIFSEIDNCRLLWESKNLNNCLKLKKLQIKTKKAWLGAWAEVFLTPGRQLGIYGKKF